MSIPRPPKPAKLVIGVFLNDKNLLESLQNELIAEFGQVDIISQWFLFDYTSYYEPEMGSPLFRRMFAFNNLIELTSLSQIKIFTNEIEAKYSKSGKRIANIDPGYMLHEKFVLATGKNFAHRIYIGNNIYADLTLIYQNGEFQTLPWTYPDYADEKMLSFLKNVRDKYVADIKQDYK
ncbi:DUF4416 family protein [Desulfobacterium sp. N47]|uniref:GTP-binding protein n=1 Tax=uncultured Desulfobacterium sp. TaxID=201089 RepID=E1YIN9_9BACT|nr:hypothetical protein N47_Q17560 [uncultured Desulfobacterium sp.]